MALLGLIYGVWALVGTGQQDVLLWGAGLLAAGVPVYLFMKRGAKAATSSTP